MFVYAIIIIKNNVI